LLDKNKARAQQMPNRFFPEEKKPLIHPERLFLLLDINF
jgi:hypothetical protein